MILSAFGGFIAMSATYLPFWTSAIAAVTVITLLGKQHLAEYLIVYLG